MTSSLPPRCAAVLQDGLREGWHFGGQIHLRRHGKVLVDAAFGHNGPEGAPISPSSPLPWMSCTKMLTSTAVALLWERGRLDLHAPVSSLLPAFGCRGKEAVTICHLLTHSAGIRPQPGRWEELDWDAIIASICEQELEPGWIPGQTAGYHIATSFMILGEIIRLIDGRPCHSFVHDEILQPLDMHRCTLDPAEPGPASPLLWRTDLASPRPSLAFRSGSRCRLRPGASGQGPASELASLLQCLLDGGQGPHSRLLAEKTVDLMLRRWRHGTHDLTFGKKIDWGLGFMLDSKAHNSDYPYSFGPHCSPSTFGHNGNQSSAAYADPEHDLVVSFILDGQPGETAHMRRLEALNRAIYEDLGLD